jgi:uncharacterized protein DUF1629
VSRSYFRLTFGDPEIASRPVEKGSGNWLLGIPWENEPNAWPDVWAFTRGERAVVDRELVARVAEEGRHIEFNIAEFQVPIVSRRAGDILESMAPENVQRIPISIDKSEDDWEILNVLARVECLDRERSKIDYYPNDPLPDEDVERAGKPRGIRKLVIDPEKVGTHQIFRITDWEVAIIVSESVKDALQSAMVSGTFFICVTP